MSLLLYRRGNLETLSIGISLFAFLDTRVTEFILILSKIKKLIF